MSALVHPADGLYATSMERLWELMACWDGRRAFRGASARINGAEPGPSDDVRITWSLLVAIMDIYPCLGWLIDIMAEQERITPNDHHAASVGYWVTDHQTAEGRRASASLVMDLLLTRAKREGLVAK
jgi:hypothetical protein